MPGSVSVLGPTGSSFELELTQLRPPRIGLSFVCVVRRVVEILTADGAQARAVGAADNLSGHGEGERVARPTAQVQRLAVDVGGVELLSAPGLVDLAGVHLD